MINIVIENDWFIYVDFCFWEVCMRFFIIVICIFLTFSSFSKTLTLDDILSIAITNNREIKQMEYSILSSEKNRDFVSSFDNPSFSFETSQNNIFEAMFGVRLHLNFYKKSFLYQTYDKLVNIKKSEYAVRISEILTDIKKLYFRNLTLLSIMSEYSNLVKILKSVQNNVMSRYLSAKSTQKDILWVKAEISKTEIEINRIEREIFENERKIAYLCGMGEYNFTISYNYSDISNVYSVDISLLSFSNSVYLRLLSSEVELSKFRYRFSYIDSLPDVMLTLKSDLMNKYSVMFEVDIPLFFGRNLNMIEMEKFMYESSIEMSRSKELEIDYYVKSLKYRITNQRDSLNNFYTNVLLTSKAILDITIYEYVSGKSTVYDIMFALKEYLMNTISYYEQMNEIINATLDLLLYTSK